MLTNATFDYLELLDYLRSNAIKYIQMKKAIKWILIVFCILAAIAAAVFFTAGKKYYITRVVKYNTGGIAYIYIKHMLLNTKYNFCNHNSPHGIVCNI